ncbi:2-succinyl-5-enolpyruvyl-6-hydroxy-3-cyclohexene-1-carboxylic-acid synthase [Glutamicibacter sp.]|uniref:2-succinyl-5-enolpyruvyl-6-hydroxy-3- cyclohexene-1-carboxylic-acid synthase n=1 Tax=Glutamicibacter sp. TaxID=1931995 RepID=UPI0028BEE467|nr:2-succinyl-5-enolpyruvyl-6-hydroxy-3-cyclohexene-1-carboxylic-acid synthase [Glutamicibacter sp.]
MAVPQETGQRAISTARQVLGALIAAGIRDLVISPGSRSAPLAYAAAEAEAAGILRLHVRIDERSAAFVALGLSQASGLPVAVAATSGSAIGQMLPAVMEANHTAAALLVLSADRPDELLGTGASQSTTQKNLFGPHVRAALNVVAGTDPSAAVAQAVAALRGGTVPPGPVQLNLQFRDPLTPEDHAQLAGQEWTRIQPGTWGSAAPAAAWEDNGGGAEHRTVVVAGHGAGSQAQAFARAQGLPLFAEPSSNARFSANAIGHYRPLLAVGHQHIERVVLFGRPTLSRPVGRLLADPRIETAIWEPSPAAWYEPGRRRETPISDPQILAQFAGTAPAGWLQAWQELDAQAQQIRTTSSTSASGLQGARVAEVLWEAELPMLLIGSSNIVRDFDLAAAPGPRQPGRVFANRGLAGIDGTISTALGLALASGERTVAVMGDITFAHDAGSMVWTKGEATPTLDVVVYNDQGGAIFSTLEHGAVHDSGRYERSVERLFGTEQVMNIAALAEGYGWEYHRADTADGLAQLMEGSSPGALRVIEVPASRAGLRAAHLELNGRIAALSWPRG